MSLERYVPRYLINQLVAEACGRSVVPERFEGVILLVDIVDSTGITERFAAPGAQSAERLTDILNRYFGGVMDLVDAYGGDSVRVDGDAVIALWRPQQPGQRLDDLAVRAATAAEAIRDAYRDWQPEDGFRLRHRLTLVSGTLQTMLVSDGADKRFFVLAGEAIAGLDHPRLRGDPDQIVLGDAIARMLGARVRMQPAACGSLMLLTSDRPAEDKSPGNQELTGIPPGPISDGFFGAVLPRIVVARADAGRADWLTELRVLSAVYVSLNDLDPTAMDIAGKLESAVRIIQSVVQPLGSAISSVHAGDKGFVVLVAFGLPPYGQEHGARRALEAAQRIPPELARIGISTSVGVATGLAFCGDVGSERRREYVSTGSVMVYATRLMQMAAGGALCDEATARAAGNPEFLSDPEPLRVKGRAAPLLVHRLRKPLPASRHQIAKEARGLYGRLREKQVLTELLDGLTAIGLAPRTGGVAAIEAEPGAGKSHLLDWIAQTAETRGCRVVRAATSAIEKETAYYVFREILPHLLLLRDDPHFGSMEILRERLVDVFQGDKLTSRMALLEDILPLNILDKGLTKEITGPARVAGIEALMVRIVQRCTSIAPLVILVDDLHWMDGSSVGLLATIMRSELRVLTVLATRPPDDEVPAAARAFLEAASPRVRLPRLEQDVIKQIIAERLGVAEIPLQLANFVYKRSEGLPFFAEQLALALRDGSMLVVEEGRCRLTVADLSRVSTPDTLRGLIVSRIDRLVQDDQITVKVASAIGRVFDADMLRRIHPLPAANAGLEDALDQLSVSGILNRLDGTERDTYAFRHVIIQGVTYDLLTYAQRRPLHRKIAQCLEERHRGSLDNHYAALAEHWEHAEEPGTAVTYRISAAEVAARRYANEDALNHVDRVESLSAKFEIALPAPDLAHCARIRADAQQELTRFGEANLSYRKLATLHGISMPGVRGALIARLVEEAARQLLRRTGVVRTLSRGEKQDRDRIAAHIYMRCAEHAYFTNNTLVLAYGTLASLNRAERAQSLPEVVNASGGLALGLSAVGLDRWAQFYRDRSIALASTSGSLSSQGFAELLACVQSFHTGDWPGMTLHGKRGAEIWQRLGDRYRHQCCVVLQGYCLIATGHYDEAERVLLGFGEHADEIESAQVRAWALAARAYLDLVRARSPQSALTRLAHAVAGGSLHPAERLLCDGIAAAAHLQANDLRSALAAAESGLDSMLQSSPAMAGALLLAVPCIAETLLVVAEHAASVGRTRQSLLAEAKLACDAARKFAARNRICRPHAALLQGRFAQARGRADQTEGYYRKALLEAQRLGLPLEYAISHLALAAIPGAPSDRRADRERAAELLKQLGADSSIWNLIWSQGKPESSTGLGRT